MKHRRSSKYVQFPSLALLGFACGGLVLLTGCLHPSHESRCSVRPSLRTAALIQTDPVMRDLEMAIDVVKHNVANANTPGYKRVIIQFQEAPARSRGYAGSETPKLGHGPPSQLVGLRRDLSDGDLWETRQALDLAIQGEGLFAVQLPDGRRAYTRAGVFQIASSRQLVTREGYPLLAGIPAVPDEAGLRITISRNGALNYTSPKGGATHQVELYRFSNPEHLEPTGENLFLETVESGQPVKGYPGENGMGLLIQGYYECSNVNLGQELAWLEQIQRARKAYARVLETEQSEKDNR